METTRWRFIIILMMLLPSLSMEQAEDNDQCLEQSLGWQTGLGDFSTITFNLNTGLNCYDKFLTRLRNQVGAPTMACGIKSTRKMPLKNKENILVNLKLSNTEWVTLGISVTTLYIWAYQDNKKYDGKFRANFLKDAPTEAISSLFPGARQRFTQFKGGYGDLQERADVTRLALVLGIPNLENAIRSVYAKEDTELNTGKSEAKFILIVAQMIAEAARFKFMEQAIINGDNSPVMKEKMVSFQNDWDAISKAIHKAEAAKPKCEKFTKTLQVGKLFFKNVNEIKDSIGILKYEVGIPSFANYTVENGPMVITKL